MLTGTNEWRPRPRHTHHSEISDTKDKEESLKTSRKKSTKLNWVTHKRIRIWIRFVFSNTRKTKTKQNTQVYMHTQCSMTFNLFRKIIVNLELNCQVQSYNTDIFRHIKVSQKNIISHSLLLHFKEREMCCNIHLYLSFLPSSNMKMDSNKTGLKTKKTCIFSKWQPKP